MGVGMGGGREGSKDAPGKFLERLPKKLNVLTGMAAKGTFVKLINCPFKVNVQLIMC